MRYSLFCLSFINGSTVSAVSAASAADGSNAIDESYVEQYSEKQESSRLPILRRFPFEDIPKVKESLTDMMDPNLETRWKIDQVLEIE
ncbi:hypothetical protein G6F55_011169 [Rhizopus delemar]|uniref:Uncharacterized protein n=2 Tax=Rhizopus TaxID=4842 RepID=A0A9P7CJC2_9FUNG|nr:hypothetical protein G6F36_012486 [Rhizopus arrhizus]KAG1447300.1 hypothetical protein G6F55_011169 [Rhizopus delemar]KAG1489286.1 hypothetical protein G6F54_011547 [Rhizopus delemar]KAG1499067.1 hypothetical protein G6F53_011595 [Rhizopus delemar]KAG1515478.1 hypothetical protein G6F52_009672 [Rhizopus delemar]